MKNLFGALGMVAALFAGMGIASDLEEHTQTVADSPANSGAPNHGLSAIYESLFSAINPETGDIMVCDGSSCVPVGDSTQADFLQRALENTGVAQAITECQGELKEFRRNQT